MAKNKQQNKQWKTSNATIFCIKIHATKNFNIYGMYVSMRSFACNFLAWEVCLAWISSRGTERLITEKVQHRWWSMKYSSLSAWPFYWDPFTYVVIFAVLNFCPLSSSHVACVCLEWWKEVLISAGGDGKVRMHNGTSGSLLVEISAHGRWINSLDVAHENSLVKDID